MSPEIVFYGGSFNPPHLGHQQIVQNVLDVHQKEGVPVQVWIVPSAAPAATSGQTLKTNLADYGDRYEMCRLAFKAFGDSVYVSDIESDPEQRHYTWNSLQLLPQNPLGLVVGADQYHSFLKWYRAEDILNKTTLYVQPRDGQLQLQAQMPGRTIVLSGLRHVASSTTIRRAVQQGDRQILEEWLDPKVLAWIEANGLYKNE